MNVKRVIHRELSGVVVLAAGLCASLSLVAAEPAGKPTGPATTAPADAASPSPAAQLFAKLDGDQDGRISRVEGRSNASLQGAFDRLDANRDGFLTTTEFALWEEAGKPGTGTTPDPALAPSGSNGAQHMPKER